MNPSVESQQSSGLVKGSVLLSLLKYIFTELNEQQKEQFILQIEPNYKDKIIANRILSTDKIPVSLLNKLTITAASIKGKNLKDFAKNAGRFTAEEGLKSIYGIYSRIRTPNVQLAKASLIWASLYDKGKMETIRTEKEKVTIKLTEIPTEEVMCERIYGWLEKTNQLAGLQNVKVIHTKCYSAKHSHCEWEISWKK